MLSLYHPVSLISRVLSVQSPSHSSFNVSSSWFNYSFVDSVFHDRFVLDFLMESVIALLLSTHLWEQYDSYQKTFMIRMCQC